MNIRNICLLTGLFVLTRLAFHQAGLSFNLCYFETGWQSIDLPILKEKYWESLFYLHSQPPLFNAFIGLVLKLFPTYYALVFQSVYLLIGITQLFLLYLIAEKLKMPPLFQWGVCVYYCLCPSVILYENWLFYTYPISLIITASAYQLIAYFQSFKDKHLYYFFMLLCTLLLTRSFFHLAYFLIFPLYLVFIERISVRKIGLSMAIPLLLIVAWMGKNSYLYNHFSTSTWLGMNVSRIMLRNMPLDEWIKEGRIHKVCKYGAFNAVEYYQSCIDSSTSYPGVSVLHNHKKVTDSLNFNHIDYIQTSDIFLRASIYAIKHRPSQYLQNVAYAHAIYFTPSSSYEQLRPNFQKIRQYANIVNLNFMTLSQPESNEIRGHFSAMLSAFFFYCIGFYMAIYYLYFAIKEKKSSLAIFHKSNKIFFFFAMFTILYIMELGNWMEFGENMRFRFQSMPLAIMFWSYLLHCFLILRKKNALKQGFPP